MLITLGSSTDLGRRETNQDSVLAILAQNLLPRRQTVAATNSTPKRGQNPAASYVQSSALLILADGMGGRSNGQLASETAAKSVYRELAHTLAMQEGVDAPYLKKALDGAIQQANNRIHQLAAKKAEAEGMGTTCTAALVMHDMICIGHVGDSRAYLFSGLEIDELLRMETQDAGIALLTADHSVVAGEVRAGRLTEEEARNSRFRNVITRAVGVDLDVEPDVFTYPVPEGAVSHLVLTSDGLHGSVDDAEMQSILQSHARFPQRAANALISAAKRAGATDNISVVVARIDATGENYKEGSTSFDFDEDEGDDRLKKHVSSAQSEGLSFKFGFWQAVCGVLILLVVAGCFEVVSLAQTVERLHVEAHANTANAIPLPSTQLGAQSLTYSAPQTLLSRPVKPSILLCPPSTNPQNSTVLVIDPEERRLLTVKTTTGLVSTSVPVPADFLTPKLVTVLDTLSAADYLGEIYRFEGTSAHPALRQYDSKGQFLKEIDPGAFSHPTALVVAPTGDIFVIDASMLKKIPVNQPVPLSLSAASPSSAT